MIDVPLFELPEGHVLPRAKTLRELDRETRPRWTRFHSTNRTPCDECITLLHEAGGVGPYARAARWRRVAPTGTLLLCTAHADAWRAEEK